MKKEPFKEEPFGANSTVSVITSKSKSFEDFNPIHSILDRVHRYDTYWTMYPKAWIDDDALYQRIESELNSDDWLQSEFNEEWFFAVVSLKEGANILIMKKEPKYPYADQKCGGALFDINQFAQFYMFDRNTSDLFRQQAYADEKGVNKNRISELTKFDYKFDRFGNLINKFEAMNDKKLIVQGIANDDYLIVNCPENDKLFSRPAPHRGEKIGKNNS